MSLALALIVIIAVAGLYLVSVYNGFVALKARIKASIQEIGNQLKRQAELIPNLEESAKGYLKHEKEILKLLADARKSVIEAISSGNVSKMSAAGTQVTDLLGRLQVVVESNPQLQAAGVVTKLMEELRDTSDKVMYARRTFIDLTADYNIKVDTFPTNIVASIFKFEREVGLETPTTGSHLSVSDSDTRTPKVSL